MEYDFRGFNKFQWFLPGLVIAYPFISLLSGHSFPQLVVYIMPCLVISLSIEIYNCYGHKDKILLALMTIWGLYWDKGIFVTAYEDIILLVCGIYCLWVLIQHMKTPTK